VPEAYHALGLHMHQPPGNLNLLYEANNWEAQQIIRCYERPARYAHAYKDVARFHVGFSGILLKQLQDPQIIDRYRQYIDIPKMFQAYRHAENIEIIGMGFYHPVFPLIPKEDWQEQLEKGREIAQQVFGRRPLGFWPSEMGFCMEMIPAIKKAGYEYVVVDNVHVQPLKESQRIDSFQAYLARYQKTEITIVPRNRDISNAQESGMSADWFINEAENKIKASPHPDKDRLVTTWSDGENGGWFRQMDEGSGFFGHFFAPFMEKARKKQTRIQSMKISDFLKKHPPKEEVTVRTGAWNVATTSGYDFSQWTGSEARKKAIQEVFAVSRQYWQLAKEDKLSQEAKDFLNKAREEILTAETSCYLFWGDSWVPQLLERVNSARQLLSRIK
jgi:alpha-amylase/alpha-mannosidase (GH57 family)